MALNNTRKSSMIDDNDDNDEINIFNLMLVLTIIRAEYNKYTSIYLHGITILPFLMYVMGVSIVALNPHLL